MSSRTAQNKHQQRTEATRRKLMNAARRIFARDGFEAARIEDIASEAGHTRGAFYANFESKEDLFFALLTRIGNERMEQLRRTLESCSTPEQRLHALREFYVKKAPDRQWAILTLEFKLFALRRGNLRAKLARAHRRVRASIHKDRIENLLPQHLQLSSSSDEARRVALEAALNGLVLEHAYDPKRVSHQQVVTILKRVFDLIMEPF